jgi:hypothetical protein
MNAYNIAWTTPSRDASESMPCGGGDIGLNVWVEVQRPVVHVEVEPGQEIHVAATLNDTWGYKSFDQNWKTAEQVLALKTHLNERGINYLLNVGPDYLGRIPGPGVEILRQVGRSEGKTTVRLIEE